jgi:hypothetical protein
VRRGKQNRGEGEKLKPVERERGIKTQSKTQETGANREQREKG